MATVIIYTNDNGGVSVTVPTGEISIEAVLTKDCPKGALIVENNALPQGVGASFFDAWELADGVVTVNLAKAKDITKKRLRAEREPLLAAQDVAFQRAQEANTSTTAIVAEKKRLRDITTLADAATTLNELKALSVE